MREEFERSYMADVLPSCRGCLSGEVNFKEIECIMPEDPMEKKLREEAKALELIE